MSAGSLPPLSGTVQQGGGSSSAAAATPVVDDSSLASFLLAGLTALYQHSSRRQEALRQQCVEVISRVKAEEKARAEKMAKGHVVPPDSDANKYFLPLKLACDTGQAKLVALALDSMEKLVAYGYLDGNCPAPEEIYPNKKKEGAAAGEGTNTTGGAGASAAQTNADGSAASAASSATGNSATGEPKRKLIHVMLETLYECSMYKDPLVQRQVLKALLTVVSSVSCPVHDHALLQAVTACYQIYLQAGDETNRTTARAALTQIFNIVFQRMEHFAAQLRQLDEAARAQREADKQQSLQNNEGIPTASPRSDASPDPASESASGDADVQSRSSAADGAVADGTSTTVGTGQLDIDTTSEAQPVEPSFGADESDSSAAPTPTASGSVSVRASPGLTPRAAPGARGYCVVCGKPANHLCLQTRDSVCGMECKLQNLAKKDPNRKQAQSVKARIANKLQVLQNDAYYLLRALIKLSHKALLTSPPEQAAVDSKLLSLTLLLSVMQSAGKTFQTNKTFITLVKGDLVNCLLRNSAASQIDTIFTLASQIFVATLRAFKPHLHRSIGPMLDSIYLPYIQSPNSSFAHKLTSLQVLRDICRDSQLLVDLFLNYDCDLGSFNTFQKIAEVLEKTAHTKVRGEGDSSSTGGEESALTDSEEFKLKTLALEALVGAMGSLAAWTGRIVKPNAQVMSEAVEHATEGSAAGGELSAGAGRTTALAAIGAAAAAAAMNSGSEGNEEAAIRARNISAAAAGDDPAPSPSPSPPVAGSASSSSASPAPAAPFLSTGASLASSFSTQFQFLRAQKQKLDSGIAKFNQKPKVGIAYLQSAGLLGTEAEDIARFFHSTPSLDKVQLGDFMGDENPFNKQVLYAYVEQMSFEGRSFDEAIREFVQGFRLPGEAQKIDRMMEKFAEQYHKNNPGRFASADTAYVLSYSIIMLNTDAHNPGVKHRMSKEDFKKNCRGIDDGKDIDPAFLEDIYDRITTNEIKMKDDPLVAGADAKNKASAAAAAAQANANNPKKRFTAFVKESQQMVRRTQELIKTKVPVPGVGSAGGSGASGGAQFRAGAKLSSTEQKFLMEVSQDQLDQPENAAPTPSSAANGSAATTAGIVRGSGPDVPAAPSGARSPPGSSFVQEKVFYEATSADAEAIRPMFEILSFPSLALFSVSLEETESEQLVKLCLSGYKHAITLACALEITTSRLAFISSLQRFTHLGSGKPMRRKHIEAIATLLSLGANPSSGNHLKNNWVEVLHTISEVERMQLIANNTIRGREGSFTQELVSGAPTGTLSVAAPNGGVVNTTAGRAQSGAIAGPGGLPSTDTLNSLQVQLLDPALIDRVFACSALLDGEAIVDFVQALRAVSEAELANTSAPRVFSLQKMVEVTRANMGRVRIVWSRIWTLLAAFFQKAGCHAHIHVSMYALDSLRQLAMKFLEKDELTSYQFQKMFFRPFEFIMLSNQSPDIRELVLQCLERMIAAKAQNIKSGWKGVFVVLKIAAQSEPSQEGSNNTTPARGGNHPSPATSLLAQSFTLLSTIMDNHFSLLSSPDAGGAEAVEEAVNALVAFGSQKWREDISGRAIQYLTNCAGTLNRESNADTTAAAAAAAVAATNAASAGEFNPDVASPRKISTAGGGTGSTPATPRHNSISGAGVTPPSAALKVWFLVLTGLSRMSSDPRPEVRSLSLDTLFRILGTHGAVFSAEQWRAVFHGVLFPIFDDVRYANEGNRGGSAAAGTAVFPSPEPVATRRVGGTKDAAGGGGGGVEEEDAPPGPMEGAENKSRAGLPPMNRAQSNIATPARPSTAGAQARRPSTTTSTLSPPAALGGAAAHFDHSWLQTTCFTALSSLVDLFSRFHASVRFLLPEMLDLIRGCIAQRHAEALAKIGVRCLGVLLQKIGGELSVGEWNKVLVGVEAILAEVLPVELLSARVRAAMGLPPLQSPVQLFYSPLVQHAQPQQLNQEQASSSPVHSASPVEAAAVPPAAALDAAAVRTLTPAQTHSRSVSSSSTSSSSSSSAVPLTLPFASPPMLSRIKVQLWVLESLFQTVMRFFPRAADMEQRGVRDDEEPLVAPTPRAQKEVEAEIDAISPAPASSESSFASSTPLDFTDRRVLGCLTPVQTLYAVDLLSTVLNCAHAFNADITLRRKLHSAGFFIPPPNTAPPASAAAPAHPGLHPSTVPASPAPIGLPTGALPALPAAVVPGPGVHAAGAPKPARLPQLFYHEAHALRLSMDILFRLVSEASTASPSALWQQEVRSPLSVNQFAGASASVVDVCEERLVRLCQSSMHEYVSKTMAGQLVSLEHADEVLVGAIHNLAAFPPPLFLRYLPRFYSILCELVEYAAVPSIRHAIRLLFLQNIGQLLQQQGIPVLSTAADGTTSAAAIAAPSPVKQ